MIGVTRKQQISELAEAAVRGHCDQRIRPDLHDNAEVGGSNPLASTHSVAGQSGERPLAVVSATPLVTLRFEAFSRSRFDVRLY